MAKLRHIAITVPDPRKAAEFYMQAFGLKKVGETDWENASGVYLSDGVINLALLHYKTEEAAGELGRGFVGLHHFGFLVDDSDCPLHVNRALHRIDDARKLGKHAVTRGVENAPAIPRDKRIDDLAIRRERAQRADFVDAHEAAVAFDIGGEDRGELAFDLGRVRPHQEGWRSPSVAPIGLLA